MIFALMIGSVACPVAAQEHPDAEGWRYRVAIGPQLVPTYPGSSSVVVRPFVEVDRARPGKHFEFEAPDESLGFAFWRGGALEIGPAFNFSAARKAGDVGVKVSDVDFTVEAGGFIQYHLTHHFRLRAEARHGVGGHDGLISQISADYIARDGDKWLFSIGPRITIADDRYNRAYFGISALDAVSSGLPSYRAKGGVQSIGGTVGYLRKLSHHWGMETFASYTRLIGNSADSPLVTRFGSPDQVSGGIALSYSFGREAR